MLNREVLACASESTLHFIDDEQDTFLITNLTDALEKLRRRGDIAALTKERFYENRGSIPGGSLLRENEMKLV